MMVPDPHSTKEEAKDQVEFTPPNHTRVSPHEGLDEQDKENTATDTNLAKTGLWNGPRKNVGIKIDVELYKVFKPIAQARFGSVCCCIEGLMAGIVGAVHNSKVSMGNSIRIDGGMHVHRLGLKERRRLDPGVLTDAGEVGNLGDLATPFVEYYSARPSLNPSDRQLYDDFKREGLELAWESKKALATLILRRVRECRK
jgi:hypothetical protein